MFIFFHLSEALTPPGVRTLRGGSDRPCALPVGHKFNSGAADFLEYFRFQVGKI